MYVCMCVCMCMSVCVCMYYEIKLQVHACKHAVIHEKRLYSNDI